MPSYHFETLFGTIRDSIGAPGTIGARMCRVIDACERQLPHAAWERLRRIDYERDLPGLTHWLAAAWRDGAVRAGDQGLWFGIFNPWGEDEPTCDMYVASAASYDSQSVAWSCEIDPRDGASYLDSAVLADIYRIAYGSRDGLGNNAEYPLALTYGAIAASTALSQGRLVPQLASLRGAAAGFDEGDGLFIGVFDNLRFIQQVREA